MGSSEKGDVYLSMIDRKDPLYVRFWSFGNADEPLEIVDAHVVSRRLTEANCKGDTVLDKESNMCVQICHELCDPTQGCRSSSDGKLSPTDCNVCRYVKSGETDECLRTCPEEYLPDEDNVCSIHCKVVALGVESKAIPDNQLTASSQYSNDHGAHRGRLNIQREGTKKGAWAARYRKKNQWLQVDLGMVNTVSAVATQGRADGYSQWVKTYKLEYSLDGNTFQYYRETGQTVDKEFDGNVDQNTIVKHELNPTITARYIRFQPTSWNSWISMRVELYGCKVKDPCEDKPCLNGGTCINLGEDKFKCTCLAQYSGETCENKITECYDHPVGVADTAKIADAKMTASSYHGANFQAAYGRLNGNRGDGWCAGTASSNSDWLQVDLGKNYAVCAVATQGDRNGNEWTKAFKLLFSLDGTNFNVYQGDTGKAVVFEREGNSKQIDQHTLNVPVITRYVRFNPVARHKYNCLRVEIYGIVNEHSECVNYMTLSEPTRAISDQTGSVAAHCDNKVSGWYRFDGDAGDRMADVCPSQPRLHRCGTFLPGWLRGGHPTVADGIVERTACFSWTDNCCWLTYNVNVRNCGHFYVYKLVPLTYCDARYCGNG